MVKLVLSFCQSGAEPVQVETSVVPVPVAPR